MADPSDAEQCARFMAASEPWVTLGMGAGTLSEIIEDESRESYVAVVGDVIAGLLTLELNGALRGYIKLLAVHPGYRRKGIGVKLLDFAEDRIFEQSPHIFLCVSSFNKAARRFYERAGYQEAGILKNYIIHGYDEIILRKMRNR